MFGVETIMQALDLGNKPLAPSEWLLSTLEKSEILPMISEKAKSELLIMPVILELAHREPNKFSCFSGSTFDVDAAQSLKGRCDFLLTKQRVVRISAPIIAVFEAKDDNIDHWYGQCGAEMLAARIFNEERNEPITIIHGAVTNGREWRFLRLEGARLLIDTEIYSLSNLPKLLGVLQGLIDFYHTDNA